MKSMKRHAALLFFAGATALGAAAVAETGNDQRDTTMRQMSAADRQFMGDAHTVNKLVRELGKYAQEHAATQPVKDLGRRLEANYSISQDQLGRIASDHNISLPDQLSRQQQDLANALTSLKGTQFDTAFVEQMRSVQEQAVETFEAEASQGHNAALRDYAREQVPMLKALEIVLKHQGTPAH